MKQKNIAFGLVVVALILVGAIIFFLFNQENNFSESEQIWITENEDNTYSINKLSSYFSENGNIGCQLTYTTLDKDANYDGCVATSEGCSEAICYEANCEISCKQVNLTKEGGCFANE